jgi:hypothetical protein
MTGELLQFLENVPVHILRYFDFVNLPTLKLILATRGVGIDYLIEQCYLWADLYGSKTIEAIEMALKKVYMPSECHQSPIIVAYDNHYDEGYGDMYSEDAYSAHNNYSTSSTLCALPVMAFLETGTFYVKKNPRNKAANGRRDTKIFSTNERHERVRRLIMCIWEMASIGVFRERTISANFVAPIAFDQMMQCRLAAGAISTQRDVRNIGFKLSTLMYYMNDREGIHQNTVRRAMCALSWFSVGELEAAFASNSAILRSKVDAKRLMVLTRDKMVYRVSDSYPAFAADALYYTLPLLERMRESLGIEHVMRPTAAYDLLTTIQKVRMWRPNDGNLHLYLDDLVHAHQSCRNVLDKFASKHVLVRRAREGSSRRIVYIIDRTCLYRTLSCLGTAVV